MRFWHDVLSLILATRPRAAEAQTVEKDFHDRLVTVDGYEYRYRVFVPPGWSKASVWPVILALHGAGELNEAALFGFAKAYKYEESVAALSALSGSPVSSESVLTVMTVAGPG